jgi:hypothetical protein
VPSWLKISYLPPELEATKKLANGLENGSPWHSVLIELFYGGVVLETIGGLANRALLQFRPK